MDNFRNVLFLFPVMVYYLLESMIAAIFVWIVWKFVLLQLTGIQIRYIQWVAIIWIIKVVFFDVFKLISSLQNVSVVQNLPEGEINQK